MVDVGYPHPKFGSPSSPRSVYDIRLLRDGQLVAQEPGRRDEQASRSARFSEAELSDWRNRHRVALDSTGRASVTFRNIRLPQRSGIESVQFSAYAFNSDRVKSSAVPPVDIPLPKRSQQAEVSRTAFLVTMGVNANQSRHLNLELAVSSAESARNVLRRKLLESYSKVVEIQLCSDFAADSDQATSKTATKANLQGVLDLLAGRSVDRKLREQFDPSHLLQAATPDDAVVLYIASHGYADPQGTFYLMPYDTGKNWGITEDVINGCLTHSDHSRNCASANDLLAHSISSQDLTAWWNGVDAGVAIMVLDSCHSGAVSGREFRPAPLGDPGFGQLSFDKGMVILSASQPAQTARGSWITDGKGRTLLMAAIESASEANQSQSVIELMHDAEEQLPLLAKQLYPTLGNEFQIPLLLDFSKETREVGSKPRF